MYKRIRIGGVKDKHDDTGRYPTPARTAGRALSYFSHDIVRW